VTAPSDPRLLVVVLGGRTLRLPTDTADGWVAALEARLQPLVELIAAGFRLVLTHGARVELAEALHRTDLSRRTVPPPPLDRALAAMQGVVGYAVQQALANGCRARGLKTPVGSLVTRVLVDPADPAFGRPSVPVGPPYPVTRGRTLAREAGWAVVEEAGLARRAAPAAQPVAVVEAPLVRALLAAGVVPIAAGAGGIPVVATPAGYQPVEAVVDPDLAGAALAVQLAADRLVLLTGVPQAVVGFGTSRAIPVAELRPGDARALLAAGEFPPATMGAKVEAGLRFVEAGGREAIITGPDSLWAAIDGRAGTRISK
jgi:carbamate kinase